MNNQITCPHCHKSFEPTDAYKHEFEEKLIKEINAKHQDEINKLKLEKEELEKSKQVEIEDIKKQILEKAKTEARESLTNELKDKDEQISELKKRTEEAEELELKARKEKRELEEAKRRFELDKQRQLDEERIRIRDEALKEALEKHDLKDKEKEMVIENLKKSLAEAQRKAEQGSQQTQGEVMEVELEEMLRGEFPLDNISEVKKGQRGADIIHEVIDKKGRSCGIILWESKNAKWQQGWINTLKENQRHAKAQLAVLVSKDTPYIESFAYQDGIWIANRKMALALAIALRFDLVRVNFERMANVSKSEKAEVLYQYITSVEFKHRIEAIAETFADMQNTIEIERRWFTKKWDKQQKQIRRLVDNTVGMRADLEGLVGNALPTIELLELPNTIEDTEDI